MFKKSAVLILHFAPSLRFTLSLQSAFYTQSTFDPWSAFFVFYNDLYQNSVIYSLRSKRFPSSYCAKVEARTRKKMEVGGGGRKRKNFLLSPPRSPSYLFIFFSRPYFLDAKKNACYANVKFNNIP